MKKYFLFLLLFFFATAFANDVSYQACFTPQENCTYKIVDQIAAAQHEVLVQAYSFTSRPIVKALIAAHDRGVDVKIIFDKSNFQRGIFSRARSVISAGIPAWIDDEPSVAHNKVMIFDGSTVETGSFNFTAAAQYHNAENVLIIHDAALAQQYRDNWFARQKVSKKIGP